MRVSHKRVLQECSARVPHKSVRQECPTRLSHKSVRQESHKSVLQDCPTRVPTSVRKSFLQERPTRHSHKSVRQKHPIPECPTRVRYKSLLRECPPAIRALRTRLPANSSASYETSSKVHASSLQNERLVQDFLQKSRVQGSHRSTHIKQPCQAVSRFQPPQSTPAHTPIPMSAILTSTTTRNLRFPAPATKIYVSTRLTHTKHRPRTVTSATPRNLPRKSHFHTAKPAQSTAPAQKATMSHHERQQNLHHITRLE